MLLKRKLIFFGILNIVYACFYCQTVVKKGNFTFAIFLPLCAKDGISIDSWFTIDAIDYTLEKQHKNFQDILKANNYTSDFSAGYRIFDT